MMPESNIEKIKKGVPLAPLTTMRVGGSADYFLDCSSVDDIRFVLQYTTEMKIPLHVLGGGSNTLFSDKGFRGMVIKISLKGMDFQKTADGVIAKVMAGENFDDFVKKTVDMNISGVECLSGIPGIVGAAPIQNVGAYGQEVSDSIVSVDALDRETGQMVGFSSAECGFSYRTSRFKRDWRNRFIIVGLKFFLAEYQKKNLAYQELNAFIKEKYENDITVKNIRESVLYLRKKKSMVIDPQDSESVSCGSFFINPYITKEVKENIEKTLKGKGDSPERLPIYDVSGRYKISAAFLIERSGFSKGYEKNGAGISKNHALAIVNRSCGRNEILELAEEIIDKVNELFGVMLEMEPVVVGEN